MTRLNLATDNPKTVRKFLSAVVKLAITDYHLENRQLTGKELCGYFCDEWDDNAELIAILVYNDARLLCGLNRLRYGVKK